MILTHATVLTMNPDREIIDDGAVVVSGDRIEAVGKTADLLELYPDHDRIDCDEHILMPGLIDTHVHMAQCMLRGISEGKRLAEFSNWLFSRIFPLQGSYSEADARASASLCIAEKGRTWSALSLPSRKITTRWKLFPPGTEVHSKPIRVENRPGSL